MKTRQELLDILWRNVDISSISTDEDCWVWTGYRDRCGYGQLTIDKQTERAHRLSYKLYKNNPDDLKVLHTCDTPYCINPSHLFLGTQSDNVKDMVSKCRNTKGFQNKMSHLTWEDVCLIRQMHNQGVSNLELSKRFNCVRHHISRIINGASRKDR